MDRHQHRAVGVPQLTALRQRAQAIGMFCINYSKGGCDAICHAAPSELFCEAACSLRAPQQRKRVVTILFLNGFVVIFGRARCGSARVLCDSHCAAAAAAPTSCSCRARSSTFCMPPRAIAAGAFQCNASLVTASRRPNLSARLEPAEMTVL